MNLMDDIIREAMQRGDFDNLPGQGQPLPPDDPTPVPDEMRLAHKIMKDNGIVPDWIAAGKDLDADYERLRGDGRHLMRQSEAGNAPASGVIARFRADAAAYNKRALAYNLKVPRGIAHKPMIIIE
jgi:hypothetical protein